MNCEIASSFIFVLTTEEISLSCVFFLTAVTNNYNSAISYSMGLSPCICIFPL